MATVDSRSADTAYGSKPNILSPPTLLPEATREANAQARANDDPSQATGGTYAITLNDETVKQNVS